MVLAANSGRDLSKALVYVVLLNGLVGGLIRSAFRDIRDDDDDEIFDEKNWGWNRLAAMFISDPLYGFPIIGEAAESAVYNAFGVYNPSGPLFDIAPGVPAAKRLAYDYPTGEKEANMRDIVRDVNRVLSTAGLFNSQPLPRPACPTSSKTSTKASMPTFCKSEKLLPTSPRDGLVKPL